MPELPEVETVVRDVRPWLVNRRIAAVRVGRRALRTPWLRSWTGKVRGRPIQAVERRGKWILIDLGGPWLVIHLGMTGQLTVAAEKDPLADHTHLVFTLDELGRQLRFRDVRRFGTQAQAATR